MNKKILSLFVYLLLNLYPQVFSQCPVETIPLRVVISNEIIPHDNPSYFPRIVEKVSSGSDPVFPFPHANYYKYYSPFEQGNDSRFYYVVFDKNYDGKLSTPTLIYKIPPGSKVYPIIFNDLCLTIDSSSNLVKEIVSDDAVEKTNLFVSQSTDNRMVYVTYQFKETTILKLCPKDFIGPIQINTKVTQYKTDNSKYYLSQPGSKVDKVEQAFNQYFCFAPINAAKAPTCLVSNSELVANALNFNISILTLVDNSIVNFSNTITKTVNGKNVFSPECGCDPYASSTDDMPCPFSP